MATSRSIFPGPSDLEAIHHAAQRCRNCRLYRTAEHLVFGEGPANAALVLVGEAPGREEDATGRPFIGRAGQLLDQALARDGIAREAVYITSALKHFPCDIGENRKIGRAPTRAEIAACKPWLIAQLLTIRPRAVLCLGGIAASVLSGKSANITARRGKPIPSDWPFALFVTFHPASLLHMRNREARKARFLEIAEDLGYAWKQASIFPRALAH